MCSGIAFSRLLHHMGSTFVEIYRKTVRKSGFSRRNILTPLPYLLGEGRDFVCARTIVIMDNRLQLLTLIQVIWYGLIISPVNYTEVQQ